MTVYDVNSERRRRRSPVAHTAITFQLEHILEKDELGAFVLGDSRGLVLAEAGDRQVSSVVAAYAPLVASHIGSGGRKAILGKLAGLLPDSYDPESLSMRSFEIDGETLFLCSLGQSPLTRESGMYRAVTGIRRILQQTACAA